MTFVLLATLVYISLVALLFVFQARLLYFPVRTLIATPADAGLSYTSVSLRTDDGITLTGWYVPARQSRGVILFCHGNGGNISYLLETILQYNRLALDTFIFDYRGYGTSEGNPGEQGTYLDVEAAWRYLVEGRKIPPSEIILVGRSLGGGIATWLAQKVQPRALIIESACTSVPDIAASAYRFFPARLLTRFAYNAREYLQHISCPVLVVHSPEDEIIPFSHGLQLFEAAKEPKGFLQIAGGHNDGFYVSRNLYEQGLNAFLSKHPAR